MVSDNYDRRICIGVCRRILAERGQKLTRHFLAQAHLTYRPLGRPPATTNPWRKAHMSRLCFSTELTSAEMAAWVQAMGTILAVVGAALIAGWQARRQHRSALLLQAREKKVASVEAAETMAALSRAAATVMTILGQQISDRQRIYEYAEGDIAFDLEEMTRLDIRIMSIPIHSLPPRLVLPTAVLSSTVRQFREKIAQVLRVHRTMDGPAFQNFFASLAQMTTSIRGTQHDIDTIVADLTHQPDNAA